MGRLGVGGLVFGIAWSGLACDPATSDGHDFREVADADAVACEPALAQDVEAAVAQTAEADWVEGGEAGPLLYDAACIDCAVLKAYLIQLAADIAKAELEGRDASALQQRYDALFIVYRRHC